MSTQATELSLDEQARRLRDAVAADPGAPIRVGLFAPGGYGKSTVLAAIAGAYRAAGVPVSGTVDAVDLGTTALLVDDAHRLDPAALRRLRSVVDAEQARVVVAARPWPRPAALVELAEALGLTTQLRPFDRARIGAHLAAVGVPARDGLVEFVHAQTGGVPAFVDRVARAMAGTDPEDPLEVPAGAVAELGAELERLPPDVLSFLLAEDAGAGLHLDLLGDLLDRDRDTVREVAEAARASGVLDRDGRLIPISRLTIRTTVPVDRRSAMRQRLAEVQLARGPRWAEAVSLTGDLDTALRVADQVMATADAPGQTDAARVAAAALAHRGQLARSAELFRWAGGGLSNAFAVLGLIGTGQPAGAEQVLDKSTPDGPPTLLAGAAALMSGGVRASVSGSPTEALSSLVRASSLLEAAEQTVLLPDTPAALAAVVAMHCGELTTAESVLRRAVDTGVGGVPFAVRHRLLQAWVHMCGGSLGAARERLRTAVAARPVGTSLPPRDWLFAVALEVGLARRTSDVTALRAVWAQAGDAVLRHPVDLYTLLPLGEFAVAAARLGDSDRLAAHLAQARLLLEQYGNPPLWATGLHWSCMHAAVVAEQRPVAEEHAAALALFSGLGNYHAAVAAAARCWLDVLGGAVDPASVEAVARDLHDVGLRWDAARLAGQAAIRTADRKAMVDLLECARQLQGQPVDAEPSVDGQTEADTAGAGKLSEREQQVARLVLDGLTYREVGDRLFISAKTVEHHVARMRNRLGSTNRRELLAQLRELLE